MFCVLAWCDDVCFALVVRCVRCDALCAKKRRGWRQKERGYGRIVQKGALDTILYISTYSSKEKRVHTLYLMYLIACILHTLKQ